MSFVFVIDQRRQPMAPLHPGRARYLLRAGYAAIWRRYPFTLILREPCPERLATAAPSRLRLKLDPGSRTTGLAVVQQINDTTGQVIFAAEIAHRGQQVTDRLAQRRAVRRSRRQRHTRYRSPRFANRRRPEGWLPPSLESRLANILTWVVRLRRLAPIGALAQELVKFDTQLIENPEINGTEYQQGALAGYEVREYLLEKFARRCAYCGATNIPLEIEHIIPKARSGTDRVSAASRR